MFEISASIVLIGLVSSVSLFGQYWGVMTGAMPYIEAPSRCVDSATRCLGH